VKLFFSTFHHFFITFSVYNTSVSERKIVVKSEVMKVNYCEPKSGDKCRNRKVHLSEFFFITFHHFFITYFLCMTPVLILLFDSSSSSSSFVIASSHDASFDDEEIF